MKSLLVLSLFASSFAVEAEARSMRTVLERKMPEIECEAVIKAYAFRNGLGLSSIGSTDYILEDSSGERIGNAYFSQGTCYIYVDNEM